MARTRVMTTNIFRSDGCAVGSKAWTEANNCGGPLATAIGASIDRQFLITEHSRTFHVDAKGLFEAMRKIDPKTLKPVKLGKDDAVDGWWKADPELGFLVKIEVDDKDKDKLEAALKGLKWYEIVNISKFADGTIKRARKEKVKEKRLLRLTAGTGFVDFSGEAICITEGKLAGFYWAAVENVEKQAMADPHLEMGVRGRDPQVSGLKHRA